MIYNTLFLATKPLKIFENSFQKYSQSYMRLNYINIIKEKGLEAFQTYLIDKINQSMINLLIIQLKQYDASIDIHFLNTIQKKYNFKLIFIFHNSQNSFEFIDRYYAQIADLIIIDDTPFIDDFYTILQIPFIKIDYRKFAFIKDDLSSLDFNISHIIPNTIFNSSLSNLSQDVHTKYHYTKYNFFRYSLYRTKYFKQYQILFIQNKIDNCFSLLSKKHLKEGKLLIDAKFKDIQSLYNFYWNLYSLIHDKNYKSLLNFINLNGLKNCIKIYKLYHYLRTAKKIDQLIHSKVLNDLFYESYQL